MNVSKPSRVIGWTWPWLWSVAYLLAWLTPVLPAARSHQSVGLLSVLALWVAAALRETSLSRKLKAQIRELQPDLLDTYKVGSLALDWNHSRLVRASHDECLAGYDAVVDKSEALSHWLACMHWMFWIGPMTAVCLDLLARRT
jgi:hypothetical protein